MTGPRERVLLVVLSLFLLVASSNGADFGQYIRWAEAALSGDIFALGGPVLSPMGVPNSIWSPGTGLLFALGKGALDHLGRPDDADRGAHVVGWLATLGLWWAMARILHRATDGDRTLVAFGLAIAFLGTHAGYYSIAHSSETFADSLVALLALQMVGPPVGRMTGMLATGAIIGLLVLVRPPLLLYGLAGLTVVLWRWFVNSEPWSGSRRSLVIAALVFLPIGIALAAVGLVNRWMTGSMSRSPYAFGDGSFHSVDWVHPEFAAVLLHPWHGLLVYHPLYALGVAAAIWRIWRPVSAAERALWGVVLIALAAHVYLQASWFAWWLGTDTFGSRGLSVASVILVPALLRVLAGSGRAARVVGREAMVVAAAVCALWSYLLLLGGPSPRYATTQFYTWGALLEGQARALAHLASPSMVLFQGAGVLLAAVTLPSSSAPRHHVLVRAASVMLGGLAIGYLLACLNARSPWLVAVGLLGAACLPLVPRVAQTRPPRSPLQEKRAAQARWHWTGVQPASWGTCAVFGVVITLFANLALRTEERIAARLPPPRRFPYTSAIFLMDIRESYHEYLKVGGFEQKKAALRDFLTRQGAAP